MQRSIKLKILRPCDDTITWEDIGYLLRGLSFTVCKVSNYCLTHHLLRALKLETENLNSQGYLYCYPRLAEEYPEVPAGILCAAEGRARKVFQSNAEPVMRSERALPSFRKDGSIPIPTAGYSLLREGEDNYIADVQLLSRKGARTRKIPGRVKLLLANNWRDKNAGTVLRQLADGTLKRGIATIFRRQRDWYISIPYGVEPAKTEEDFVPGLVMGVAFGIHCGLAYGFNHSLKRGELGGEEVLSHQEKYQARKKHIREQYKWSGRQGHGRDRALKPLEQMQEKERRFRNLTNDRYAKWIVEIASKNRCGKIRLDVGDGNLSGGQKILLARWPRDELRRKIKEKAEARGIAVEECTDAEIRIRCSRCGVLNEQAANKRGFACSACGYGSKEKDNGTGYVSTDYNAARNLTVLETVNEK